MKKYIQTINIAIVILLFTISCKKENVIQLEPIGSLNVNLITSNENHVKQGKSKLKAVLPASFNATLTIKGNNIPEKIVNIDANQNGSYYEISSPIEAPINKPITITINAEAGGGLWYGISNEIILNEEMTPYQTSILIQEKIPTIGDSFQGGIVFYITSGYGLICAPKDQSSGIPWTNGGNMASLINVTKKTIGTGKSNTTSIVNVFGAGNYAAKLCDDLVLNGYDDWFLPSKDELGLMYSNLKSKGLGNLSGYFYWSSSVNDLNNAYIYLNTGDSTTHVIGDPLSVRAVRSFAGMAVK